MDGRAVPARLGPARRTVTTQPPAIRALSLAVGLGGLRMLPRCWDLIPYVHCVCSRIRIHDL